jgi:hypothetical protein
MDAKLIFDQSDKQITVYQIDLGFTQYTDDTGKPSGYPTGGTINMVVEGSTDTQLIDWMLKADAKKSGKIEIQMKKVKVISFKNAYCVQYHESFNYQGGDQPMTISFTRSAETITVDSKSFTTKRKTT